MLAANDALARLLGYDSPEQLLAEPKDIAKQLHLDPARRAAFVQLMHTQAWSQASKWRCAAGTVGPYLVRLIADRSGGAVICQGQEALEKTRTHKPELLLLDLLMPRMTGMEVLDGLRADPETRDTRVLILSNSSKELEMHEAERLGVAGYWIKANLSLQELGDRVASFFPSEPSEPPVPAAPSL